MTDFDADAMYRALLSKLADVYQEWSNLNAAAMADWHPVDAIDRCLTDLNGILANHLWLCEECDAPTFGTDNGQRYKPCGHIIKARPPGE